MCCMSDPAPTFAAQQLSRVEALLAANPGVTEITVDGVTTKYADLQKVRDYWRREVNREQGKRSQILSVDLSGF